MNLVKKSVLFGTGKNYPNAENYQLFKKKNFAKFFQIKS